MRNNVTGYVSKVLRTSRRKQNLTQQQLAKRLGFKSAQMVSNWERGIACLPIKKINKISKVLDLPKSILVGLMVANYRENLKAQVNKIR